MRHGVESVKIEKEGIMWWRNVAMGDCEAHDVTDGAFHFRAIDYGDTTRLSGKPRKAAEKHRQPRIESMRVVAFGRWG